MNQLTITMNRLTMMKVRCLVFAWLGVVVGVSLVSATPAFAQAGVPRWTVTVVSTPTNFTPGSESGEDVYRVLVTNTGGAETNGEPVTITDTLPSGLTLNQAGIEGFKLAEGEHHLSCSGRTCTVTGTVVPEQTFVVLVPVDVAESVASSSCVVPAGAVGCVSNVVRVSGGGAPDATVSTPTVISTTPAGFGIAPGSVSSALSSPQAGAHADLTTTIAFNTISRNGTLAGEPKEIVDHLPPGFGGDLVDTPTCPVAVFERQECPIETQIGVQTYTSVAPPGRKLNFHTTGVYNLTPDPGDVAKVGFATLGALDQVQGDVRVDPDGYGLIVRFQDILQSSGLELDTSSLTVWGVPSAKIHDTWRWNDLRALEGAFGATSTNPLVPYLTNPTSCSGEPIEASISAYSWEAPEGPASTAQMPFGPLTGCDRLSLPASFLAQPTTTEAYAPTGLNAELGVHQTDENAEGLASAHLNKAVVMLPEGMTVNPSAGAGLVGCTQVQYEAEVLETPAGEGCPNESKLGSVKITAPAVKEEAFGSVFLAEPYENPFSEPGHPNGSLLALYMVARIPNRGVIVKAAGKLIADPVTGRLTTVFENLPQLPFTTFTLSFRQGETSPLVTPPVCGSFSASAQLTAWSSLNEALSFESPAFEIVHGFGGGACPTGGVPPFSPGVDAGALNNDAGSYTPFNIRISRNDGEQELTGFGSQLPLGLTAKLTGVPFCPEADIALARTKTGVQEETEPSCPAASEIGQTLVGAGVGQVLAWAPGKIYMAGPFEGAPFSVVSITSAHVGPFDLGTVIVHLPLQINPVTAAVSIPAGAADQIPHIIDGIVIHVRDIRVDINRPNFMINPTSCEPLAFSATPIGGGANPTNPADNDPVTVSNPFRVTACQALSFQPTFKVTTSGKTSRADGANVNVRLTYPNASQGTQANIKEVKVDLPKQLPSRLTTLQKACTDAQFEANPAGCPPASIVGHATANTPILPVPLTGPAYFVSHGGAKFPELVIVLQGYGVTLQLHGETFINKAGITSSTFHTIPDAPVGSFELTLPQGPDSALAANGNLCTSKLVMPTAFVAQNGATIHQSTPIEVTGCKPAVSVVRHSVKGATVTIVASVPSAGRLLASGPGLSRAVKRTGGADTVTLTLKLSARDRTLLKAHPGRKLKVAVKLLFTPAHGQKLTAGVSVNVG